MIEIKPLILGLCALETLREVLILPGRWDYHRRFRRLLLRRFPYKIFYQIIENRVVVFRVSQAKQTHQAKLR